MQIHLQSLAWRKSHTHPPRIDVERQLFSSHLTVIELSLLYTSISVFLVLLGAHGRNPTQ